MIRSLRRRYNVAHSWRTTGKGQGNKGKGQGNKGIGNQGKGKGNKGKGKVTKVMVKVTKVKVKFTLEQATKAQRGSRRIALLFH
jgi:hypothetical protein